MRGAQHTIRLASLLGLGSAGAAAAMFIMAAGGQGQAGAARYGGAAWVFSLAWIITGPVLAPWLKGRPGG